MISRMDTAGEKKKKIIKKEGGIKQGTGKSGGSFVSVMGWI